MLVSYGENALQYKYLEDNKGIVIKTINTLMGLTKSLLFYSIYYKINVFIVFVLL